MTDDITSVWISANAGSGKTRALVDRVVRLLLLGVQSERICCITYTKAAAAEMRERIVKTLRELLVVDDTACQAKVAEILGRDATTEDIARARNLFAVMLDSPFGGVQLTTIHGFCQQLLKKFPIEAGISPLFTVLEDADRERLQRAARMRLFDMREENALSEALALLADRSGETRVGDLLDAIEQQRGHWRDALDHTSPEHLRARIYAHLGVAEDMDAETLSADFIGNLLSINEANDLRAALPELLNHKNKGEQKLGAIVVRWFEAGAGAHSPLAGESPKRSEGGDPQSNAEPKFPNSASPLVEKDEKGISVGGREIDSPTSSHAPLPNPPRKGEGTTARAAILEELLAHFVTQKGTPSSKAFSKSAPMPELLERLRDKCTAHVQQRANLACAEESAALALVAAAYRNLMQQLKFEHQALDYDDLIERASELLCGSMIGWVMRKLDHRIDHLLVDEAQDTSPAQWRIARALVEELMATSDGLGSGDVPRSLLVVGDEKQSIFSFQGAAPECFAREEAHFQHALSESNAPLTRAALTVSYRSGSAVLQLVDKVAAMPSVAPALTSAGEAIIHQLHRTQVVGSVTLHPLVISEEKAALEPFVIPKEYVESQSAAQLLADQIAEQIAGWLGGSSPHREGAVVPSPSGGGLGWGLPQSTAPDAAPLLTSPQEGEGLQRSSSGRESLTPGDILILVHKRRPMAPALIRALEKHGVPVSGMDRLILSKHLAVRDLLALMRWCGSPHDDLALAVVLRSPIIGISDEALRTLAVGRTGSLWATVEGAARHPGEGRDPCEKNDCRFAPLDDAFMHMDPGLRRDDAVRALHECIAVAARPPYEFLTHVLEVQGARRRFAERFGEEVHEILDELKAQAARMPATMVPSIAYFHDWMVRSERVIKREQDNAGDKVRIMTVHGAKGLEAPVVILADTMTPPSLRKEVVYWAGNPSIPEGERCSPSPPWGEVRRGADSNSALYGSPPPSLPPMGGGATALPLLALSAEAARAPVLEAAKQARKSALQAEYQRLLYVALTRARDELHIYGASNTEPKEAGDPVSWYDTIATAMGDG